MVDNFHKPQENIRLRVYCGQSLCLLLDISSIKRAIAQGFSLHGLGKLCSLSSGLVLRLIAECSFPLRCPSGRVGRRVSQGCRDRSKALGTPPALVHGLPQPWQVSVTQNSKSLFRNFDPIWEKTMCSHCILKKNSFNKYLPRIYRILRIGQNRKMNKTHHSPQRADYRGLFTSREKGPSVV